MSRSTVRCSMGHTSLFPGKNDARSWWAHEVPFGKGIITISHGALDVLNILRVKGPIMVTDIDPGVVESTNYLRGQGQGARFPNLNLLPARCLDIFDATRAFVDQFGIRILGAVDCDLACGVEEAWRNARSSVEYLHECKFKGMFLLTFRNGRDDNGLDGTNRRVSWLKNCLPKGAKITSHKYRSDWVGRFATREMGSSMCIVKIHF